MIFVRSRKTLTEVMERPLKTGVPGGAIRQRFSLASPGERSIGKDRISEILVLVNTLENTSPPKFSILGMCLTHLLQLADRNLHNLLILLAAIASSAKM